MAVDQNRKLAQLQQKESDILGTLRKSPTAARSAAAPEVSDIAAQRRLLQTRAQIENIKDEKLKNRWYGEPDDQEPDVEGGQPGAFGKAIDVISRPLYSVMGAADYAFGNSPKESLSKAMAYNATEAKRTAGDILKDSGVPGVASAPLGFMLDVAFDPVNWATLGTAALVPRTVYGVGAGAVRGGARAGVKAAARGAESRLLEGALTTRNVGRAISGSLAKRGSKAAKAADGETLGTMGRISKALEQRSAKTASEYDELVGRDFLESVPGRGKPYFISDDSPYKVSFGDLMREGVENVPYLNKWFKYFDYNNAEWTRLARIKDILMRTAGTEEEFQTSVKAYIRAKERGMSYEDALRQARQESGIEKRIAPAGREPTVKPEQSGLDFGDQHVSGARPNTELDRALEGLPNADDVVENVESVPDILNSPEKFVSADHIENARRLAQEEELLNETSTFIQDLKDIIGRGELGETGVEWYDKLKRQARNFEYEVSLGGKKRDIGKVLGKTIDGYEAFIATFKRAAVGGSPSAWTNAIIGNPTMAWMAGVNILDPVYIGRIKQAAKIKTGRGGADLILGDFLMSSEALKVMKENPSLFRETTGMSPSMLHAKHVVERIVRFGRDEGLVGDNVNLGELGESLGYAFDEIADAVKELTGARPQTAEALGEIGAKTVKGALPSASRDIRHRIAAGEKITANVSTEMVANEFFDSRAANAAFSYIEKRAEEGNKVYQLLNLSFNRMADAYGGVDQSYKLGTTMYAMMDGFTEKEMRTIARMINLSQDDLTKVVTDGITRYKMNGNKALELSNEIYLNYAAMPPAIRALRNTPLIGSPFASFAYGMGLKTAKTTAYNPAAFNRVTFAMDEFSGEKTPLEKGVLTSPYYSYLNEPGMLRIPGVSDSPFFKKNSLYLNVANMVPYYSFNMFTPPERRYEGLYGDVVSLLDKSPFLQDPVGQSIFDHLIQPMILKEARPQGGFGQPLFPIDATKKERAGYFARSLVDPLVPGFWTPFGAAAERMILPKNIPFTETPITEAMPSYRWRRLSYATQGKTALGTKGNEEALSRTMRALAGTLGVPIQSPVRFTNLPPELEKRVKNTRVKSQ